MKVTQHVNPTASAKRTRSSVTSNLILHLTMDWTQYRHVGMTPQVRDRVIAGLRTGEVDPLVLCETLGITSWSQTNVERDRELLDSARAEVERAAREGFVVLGAA
jgi:hypothetical protein